MLIRLPISASYEARALRPWSRGITGDCEGFETLGNPKGEGNAEEAGEHIGYGLGEHDALQAKE